MYSQRAAKTFAAYSISEINKVGVLIMPPIGGRRKERPVQVKKKAKKEKKQSDEEETSEDDTTTTTEKSTASLEDTSNDNGEEQIESSKPQASKSTEDLSAASLLSPTSTTSSDSEISKTKTKAKAKTKQGNNTKAKGKGEHKATKNKDKDYKEEESEIEDDGRRTGSDSDSTHAKKRKNKGVDSNGVKKQKKGHEVDKKKKPSGKLSEDEIKRLAAKRKRDDANEAKKKKIEKQKEREKEKEMQKQKEKEKQKKARARERERRAKESEESSYSEYEDTKKEKVKRKKSKYEYSSEDEDDSDDDESDEEEEAEEKDVSEGEARSKAIIAKSAKHKRDRKGSPRKTVQKSDDEDDEETETETLRYVYLRQNMYLHRKPTNESKDNIPICCCIYIDGISACNENCINRLVMVECHPKYCPCGDKCENQRFQKSQYAKLTKFEADKKGFGLKAAEEIKKGNFVIEYVGEVIDVATCKRRLDETKHHKHFYFLTLNTHECIDASRKGNLARYINHSCNPNAQTQKWYVKGEMRVGIFALRDIKPGEEVTFDYKYERIGTKKQDCLCGESNCRGYLGAPKKPVIKAVSSGNRGGRKKGGRPAAKPVAPPTVRRLKIPPATLQVLDKRDPVEYVLNFHDQIALQNILKEVSRNSKLFLFRNIGKAQRAWRSKYESLTISGVSDELLAKSLPSSPSPLSPSVAATTPSSSITSPPPPETKEPLAEDGTAGVEVLPEMYTPTPSSPESSVFTASSAAPPASTLVIGGANNEHVQRLHVEEDNINVNSDVPPPDSRVEREGRKET